MPAVHMATTPVIIKRTMSSDDLRRDVHHEYVQHRRHEDELEYSHSRRSPVFHHQNPHHQPHHRRSPIFVERTSQPRYESDYESPERKYRGVIEHPHERRHLEDEDRSPERKYRPSERAPEDDDDEEDYEHRGAGVDPDAPLDLSMNKKYKKLVKRERCDSGTESEDSSGGNGAAQGRSAYKKSLMKRYCE